MVIGWILPVVGAALAIATLSWLYQGINLKRFLTAVATAEGENIFSNLRQTRLPPPALTHKKCPKLCTRQPADAGHFEN